MKKKKAKLPRNPAALPAKTRKAGPHKPKKNKRKNGKNKQDQYLNEDY